MIHSSRLVFVLTLVVVLTASGAWGQTYSGVITVDSVAAEAGQQVAVGVRLSGNDAAISALEVPLRIRGADLTVDSVSFAGSILPLDFDGLAAIDNSSQEVTITYLSQYINPVPVLTTDGLLATLFVSVDGGATPAVAAIDSVCVDSVTGDSGPAVRLWKKIHATDQTGTVVYVPGFAAGEVVVTVTTGIEDKSEPALPNSFSLAQNFPNPFNPSTVIEFVLPQAGYVKLEVFNILGQKARSLVDRRMSAGRHQVRFDAENLPSGIYFYRLSHGESKLTRKMVLIK
ncbi:MAG: T9SS type A sorting domain-containing protein [bacterium]